MLIKLHFISFQINLENAFNNYTSQTEKEVEHNYDDDEEILLEYKIDE